MSATPDHVGEGVYYRQEDYAGVWRRLVVDVIDILVVLFVSAVLLFALAVVFDGQVPTLAVPLILALVAVMYLVVLKGSRVRTLGYRIAGTRIVNLRGQAPGLDALASRLLFAVCGPLNLLLDILWIPGDERRQALREQ